MVTASVSRDFFSGRASRTSFLAFKKQTDILEKRKTVETRKTGLTFFSMGGGVCFGIPGQHQFGMVASSTIFTALFLSIAVPIILFVWPD